MADIDLSALERLLDKAEWPKYDGQDGMVLRALIQRVREAEARSVPVEPGDLELYGDDPYSSARSWHEAWMKSEARIAQLERVGEAAEDLMALTFFEQSHFGQIDQLREALSALKDA